MIEVSIFIPVADNDGHTFPPSHHRTFEAFILERFGGLSRSTSQVEGLWVDEGRTYQDTLTVYMVALPSITEGGKLSEVLDFAKRHYRQEAIFLRYLGIAEII